MMESLEDVDVEGGFQFVRPEEAPTFYPTEEEFADPLEYIRSIRERAERFGICKIKPPQGWTPPFSVDMNEFKFTPRVQKINELEAMTRIRINFMEQISKFWEVQGSTLHIPEFEGRKLDLYSLYQLVHSNEFRNSRMSDEKKWSMVANRLGFKPKGTAKNNNIGNGLKSYYEKIVQPYDAWKSENCLKNNTIQPKKNRTGKMTCRGMKAKYCLKGGLQKMRYVCEICLKMGFSESQDMLKCLECRRNFHASCVTVGRNTFSKEWSCPECLTAKMIDFIDEDYGFEEADKTYTLTEFQEMADRFKCDYFKGAIDQMSSEQLEKEFWRIVSNMEESVIVEYGADVSGTGFPTTASNRDSISDVKYVDHCWNLNKLPILKGSAFAHIKSEVSGMKSPWVYVGMCFSTFCWHNEDHWSYSISYLHRGDPKTWYGVPGKSATDFERAMKSAAPELFTNTPDLLHRLVTLVNPNILMRAKVPVYRMDQNPGEFIITFPRSYHAGFNQGFNFAEAVNFAPADWIPLGRECVGYYSEVNRLCVFSHDELVCEMAKESTSLTYHLALATYSDMIEMLNLERRLRAAVMNRGVRSMERVEFEKIVDDKRQCSVCRTTLFLSAFTCTHAIDMSVDEVKMVCLRHCDQYDCKDCKIDPTKYILKYKYTLEELLDVVKKMKRQLHFCDCDELLSVK